MSYMKFITIHVLIFIVAFVFFFHLRQSLALLPSMECSGGDLGLLQSPPLGSSDPPTWASQVAGTIGAHHHAQQFLKYFVDIGSPHVAQAGLKLLSSSDPPALASQSAEIRGVSLHAWPICDVFHNKKKKFAE